MILKPTDEQAARIREIDAAFDAGKLSEGIRLQQAFRRTYGRDAIEFGKTLLEDGRPRIHVGTPYAQTGGYRKSGASKRRSS